MSVQSTELTVTFDHTVLGSLSIPELAVFGTAWYMTTGRWQHLGVMPPPRLHPCPCDLSLPRIADILGITTDQAEALWLGLIQKGAINHESNQPA